MCFSLSSRDPAPRGERPNKGAALHGLGLQLHDASTPDSAQLLRVPLSGQQPLPLYWKRHRHAPPLLQPCRAQLHAASQTSRRYSNNMCMEFINPLFLLPHMLSVCVFVLLWQQPAPPQVLRLRCQSGTVCSCPVKIPPPGPLKRWCSLWGMLTPQH